MSNVRAILFGVSILTLPVVVVFLAIGVVSYLVYNYLEDQLGLHYASKYLFSVAVILPIFIILALIFRRNIIMDVIDGFIVVLKPGY
ncbi:MAG: hypothetical protein N3D82_04295 [Ignisphaera sp.]|nr:hypothetical protein [Ignisphaera sp.]MCX8168228.1 hypothetical protein [Ignisphaera sp.]MDW8084903.1 hypothetical protein [Ignisphaera sp.]